MNPVGSKVLQVPVTIEIGNTLSQTHVATVNKLGYANIVFTPTDIYPDDSSAADGINRNGVYTTLYPYNKDEYGYASGAEMGYSRNYQSDVRKHPLIKDLGRKTDVEEKTGTFNRRLLS